MTNARTMAPVDDPDFNHEEIVVEIDLAKEFRTSGLGWQAMVRVLPYVACTGIGTQPRRDGSSQTGGEMTPSRVGAAC